MKRVVIIGPDFTPSSYPPALRIKSFAKHLLEHGWEPIVVTMDPRQYEWPVDAENERLLPETLQVIRTGALPIKLTRKIGIGDLGLRTLWQHWRVASRLCREKKADLIFIPVPPYYPAVLGRLLNRSFGVPYVIDYIDPWVSMNYWKLPPAQRPLKRTLSYALSVSLEPFALKQVGHIVGVSKGTTDYVVARYPWLSQADATEIPYGGEEADFDYLRLNPRPNKIFNGQDGFVHVSYIGACNFAMRATVRALLEATRIGLERAPEVFTRLRMHFVGTNYSSNAGDSYQVLPMAQELGVEAFVDEHPSRIPYLDSLQLLLDSNSLLMVGSDAPHYTASKVFPYILARKPLLALFHQASSVVSILQETQAGQVVTFSNDEPIEGKIEEIFNHLKHILSLPPAYEPPTRWEAFKPYSARSMAARLAQAFNKALDKNHRQL